MVSTIKDWSPQDRPREKLMEKGVSSLSDAELIAILFSTGHQELSALDLAKKLMLHFENDLILMARAPHSELCKLKGIGPAKSLTVIAALELGRRRRSAEARKKTKIESSKDVFE
ncbi:MAG: UPF0758 domain-containing protein, partial [Flavobacteriales bacterium]